MVLREMLGISSSEGVICLSSMFKMTDWADRSPLISLLRHLVVQNLHNRV